ncbi:hypothetical protein GQ53DRAFT_848353 [Thozetella sp. PMI_491]|nr:hypothetical protein GQ53DRAFT_848353 [Thozetella sp. PMI_491]
MGANQKEQGKKKAWTRQRTGTPRSRSGCITCKIRHTKCDEARPFCQRCLKSGFQCDGYEAPPPQEKKGKLPGPLELAITSYALPFRVPGSQEDRRMLHYFCVQAAEDLSGYLSPDFWNKIVLQRSHDEQVVRQAVIALSSVHLENAMMTSQDISRMPLGASEEILMQYNKSLRCLRKYLNHSAKDKEKEGPSLIVVLVCCALFYCFETARGNGDAAFHHLKMAVSILSNEGNREEMSRTAQDMADMFKLEDLFQRLDLAAAMYQYDRTPLLDLVTPQEKMGLVSCIGPQPFRGLEEAHTVLAKLQNWTLHLLIPNPEYKFGLVENLPPEFMREKEVLGAQFALWHDKFEAMLDANDEGLERDHGSPGSTSTSSTDSNSDLRSHPSALLALVHYHNATLFLAASIPYNPVVFEAPMDINPYRDKIEAILQYSETIINLAQHTTGESSAKPGTSSTRSSRRRVISAGYGVIAPLAFLAFKCADRTVVVRAQALLERSERKEGMYDGPLSGGVAKRMMELSMMRDQMNPGADLVPQALEWQHIDLLETAVGIEPIAERLGVK